MNITLLKKAVAVFLVVPLLLVLAFPLVAMAATANDTISIQYSNGNTEKVNLGKTASAYCKKKGYGNTSLSNASVNTTYSRMTAAQFCSKMYIQGFNDEQNDKADVNSACAANSLGAISNAIGDICNNSYLQGVVLGHAADVAKDSSIKDQIKTYCNQATNSSSQEKICENAALNGFLGQNSKDSICKSYSGNTKDMCEAAYDAGGAIAQKVDPTKPSGSTGKDNSDLGCDLGIDGFNPGSAVNALNPLNWLFCGIVKGLVGVVDTLDNAIASQLAVGTGGDTSQDQPNHIFADSNGNCAKGGACDAYYTAWKSFRNIALGLMVIAGLVVLISQALGMEILDAYTIRKILPRLLIAAIGITLSWQLMQLFVTFTNDLGYGVRYLIYSPFQGTGTSLHLALDQSVAVTLLGGVGYFLAGFFGLMTLAGTAALALFIAFMVLILRQIVIIMLIIMAPLGIVAYILPNTQRIWKLWWESFSKALLMFPIIAAFIATGRVFSAIASKQGDGFFFQMIAFIAYFAPYFMIPMAFRFAGGALSQISGAVNNRSQGAFGALREARKRNTANRLKAARTGGIYRKSFGQFGKPNAAGERKSVGKYLNAFGDWTLDADERIPIGLGNKGVPGFTRYADIKMSQIEKGRIDQTTKSAQEAGLHYQSARALAGQFQYFTDGLNPDARKALDKDFGLTFDENTGEATSWRAPVGHKEIQSVAGLLSQGGIGAREASQGLVAAGPQLDNFTELDSEGRRTDTRLLGMISAAQSGRLELEDIVNNHNTLVKQGQVERASRETALLQDVATRQRASFARGHSLEFYKDKDANGNEITLAKSVYDDPMSPKAQDSLARMSTQDIAGGKSEDLDGLQGETWVNAISENRMVFDKALQNRRQVPGANVKGRMVTTNEKKAPNSKELARAKEFQGKLKSIATYHYGDSDHGRKIKQIWQDAGLDPRELEFRQTSVDGETPADRMQPREDGNSPQPGAPGQ